MGIVNFDISESLNKKVEEMVKKEGFASKAEFFRFAARWYIDGSNKDNKYVRKDNLFRPRNNHR